MLNLLTFDIEEWALQKDYFGDHKEAYFRYDSMLDHLLAQLDMHNITATFFCLGRMAEEFPEVIRKIHTRGHEIGCHSYSHKWLTKFNPAELREDTRLAVTLLEDLTGEKVSSYRAPAFSIGGANEWAFEILAEEGITDDSSIFPGQRDFGGFPDFHSDSPCLIKPGATAHPIPMGSASQQATEGVIREFPIPLMRLPLLGKEAAFSGGGYFRLLPYPLIDRQMQRRDYNMCYFHIADLLPAERKLMDRREFEDYFKIPGTLKNRLLRHFKSNIGRDSALPKLERLLASRRFLSIREYNLLQTKKRRADA